MSEKDVPTMTTEDRGARVFRTAVELMVRKGFGGTSIGDIAQAVGMTKAGLYHYFASKHDMLYRIMTYAMDAVEREIVEPTRSIENPEDRLREVIRRHARGLIEHGPAITVLMSETESLQDEQRAEIVRRKESYRAYIREALFELEKDGRLRELDIPTATMHILNTIVGIARWFASDSSDDVDNLVEETVRFNMAAVLKSHS